VRPLLEPCASMALTTSMPLIALPNTTCRPSSQGRWRHWDGPGSCCRRRPEQTTLYQVVQQHLETYLAPAGEDD